MREPTNALEDEMQDLLCYKTMPVWNAQTLPEAFQRQHNTQEGTWAGLEVRQGSLELAMLTLEGGETGRETYTPQRQPPLIAPQQWHRIASVSPDMECQLGFYCTPEDFYAKKHSLTRTHSEVLEAVPGMAVGRALDVGCGRGRNTLYLALKGWRVDACDNDAASLERLRGLIEEEHVQGVRVQAADLDDGGIAAAGFTGQYDLVLSTVVMMFLQPATIAPLIEQMRNATLPGGYNLIVAAMDSEDYPCQVPFPFTFKRGELRAHYADWQCLKYNEDVGELHRRDENGNRIKMRFATLLARRPA